MADSGADLRRVFSQLRRDLPLLAAGALIAAGGAFAFSEQQPRAYEAQSILLVGRSLSTLNPDYNQLLASQRLSSTYATVATSRPLLDRVIAELDLDESTEDVAKRVSADAELDSALLTITAQDSDPAVAADIANQISQELMAESPAVQGIQAEIQGLVDEALDDTRSQIAAAQVRAAELSGLQDRTAAQDRELGELEGQLADLRATLAGLLPYASSSDSNAITVIQPAAIPEEPISPRPLLNTLLAAIVGLFVVAGALLLRRHLDDSVRDAEDARAVTGGALTLGAIPRFSRRDRRGTTGLVALRRPQSAVAEAYRSLRSNIVMSDDVPIRTLLVASAETGDGKTVIAANLAVVFAQAGRRVLLVDADLRTPGIHRLFDVANDRGLTTVMSRARGSVDRVTRASPIANLRVMTTGPIPDDPAALLGSDRMRGAVERLRDANDLVIFDSPPLTLYPDAAVLSSMLDATLLVARAQRTSRAGFAHAAESLGRAGARLLGVVMNRMPGHPQPGMPSGYASAAEVPERAEHAPAVKALHDERPPDRLAL